MNLAPQHPWLSKTLLWFDKHPEREFYVGSVNREELHQAARHFWLIGFASQPINDPGLRKPDIQPDRTTVPVVIRRADPAGGQQNPGVIVLDGGMTLPTLPTSPKKRPRFEEEFGAFIWQVAVETGRAGKSLKEALAATGLIRPA